MILLDTNIVSETRREAADRAVLGWMDRQPPASLWISTITLAEIDYGIALMPEGRKRAKLIRDRADLTDLYFTDRIAPFDIAAAVQYGTRLAAARRAGRAVATADALIAAIAASRGFAVATRDTAPFVAMGVPVLDPFTA